jgi:hypothetical protein
MSILVVHPQLIFVGQEHGKDVVLSNQIKAAIHKYGAWYEGDGKDKIKGISYLGSWDDKLAKDIDGYPKEFLFVIFTNTAINRQKSLLAGSGSIFDRLLKAQDKLGYFKNRRFNENTLTEFLNAMGDEYLRNSKNQATQKNVDAFISKGEKDMWESGKTSARKLAEKANKKRDMWLLSQPKGVYFVGSDHLKELNLLMKTKNNNVEKTNSESKRSKLI